MEMFLLPKQTCKWRNNTSWINWNELMMFYSPSCRPESLIRIVSTFHLLRLWRISIFLGGGDDLITWVFLKILVPQNGWCILENPIKMDDLWVPLFLETPTYSLYFSMVAIMHNSWEMSSILYDCKHCFKNLKVLRWQPLATNSKKCIWRLCDLSHFVHPKLFFSCLENPSSPNMWSFANFRSHNFTCFITVKPRLVANWTELIFKKSGPFLQPSDFFYRFRCQFLSTVVLSYWILIASQAGVLKGQGMVYP